jgi:HTH-type transcriptional regulator / antitoxin HigA
MTLTFNRDRYKDLLSEYQPKLIKTEAENEQALAMVEKLMHLPSRSPEQQELYELLIVLVEKFEQEFYQPRKAADPLSMLLFLMEQREMEPVGLSSILGSDQEVKDILAGKTKIDKPVAILLGELFHVSHDLFAYDD